MDVLPDLLGSSPAILAVKEQIGRLLRRQSSRGPLPPVLVQGETGTGKGLLAHAIHRASSRGDGPFVDVNCAAIPETLLEAELFGFERGAFTDARQAKAGLFQTAHRGTIFLDEVGLLPDALQAKLLKVIEERTVRRLGSTRSEPIDVWLLAATNEDLLGAIRGRRFREDLYHRLAVLMVTLPPLRERPEDIPLLAEHFLTRACADYSLPAKILAPEARRALLAYAWPGNIRELANAMERAALLGDAWTVTKELLALPSTLPPSVAAPAADPAPATGVLLEEAVGSVERQHLVEALGRSGWNITRAAAQLGISRDTLRYRVAKYGLRPGGLPGAARRSRGRPEIPAPTPMAPRGEPSAPAALRWERRRLTLLRVALATPDGADPRLYPSRALEAIVAKVRGFGGRVEEHSPSGLVAVFGLEPLEDTPRHAAHAAMAIRNAVQRVGGPGADALPVRLALHVVHLLVGRAGDAAQIDMEGKRLAWIVLEELIAHAEPDGPAVSAAARPFLERHFELVAARADEPGREAIYRLGVAEGTAVGLGRRMAPFAGRAHELELLTSRLALALRGHGQAVGILGDAGMGKSRLVFEFRRALQDLRVTCLEAHCQSYATAIPYLPILEILRQNFRVTELDGPEVTAEKVRVGLQELGLDPDEWAPYLLHLFGIRAGTEPLATLSPGAIKARTFEALRQMGLNGSRRRPIVFLFEDLQWIDATSEECLSALMESMRAAPALVVGTYRPGYHPPWVDKSYVTQIALQPLSDELGLGILLARLQTDHVPEPLARVILERAEGNPFFIEELARVVEETAAADPARALPATIQEVLQARIDRLSEGPRRLLQCAAVLGRQTPLGLLRDLWDGPGDREAHLRELRRLEFLYPHTGGAEPVYAFINALTQEVAYESLPSEPRRALHAAAARALEHAFAGRLEEVYDRLGHHYSRAGVADKAIDYLTRLAERAAGAHAHTEAVRTLEEARRHADRLPDAERDRRWLDLVIREAYSLFPQGEFQQIVDLLLAHRVALERLGDPAVAGPYHLFLARSFVFLGDDAHAAEHAERALAEATRSGDNGTLGRVHYMLAQRCSLAGYPREGLEHGRRAVALLEQAGDRWWLATTWWAVAVNHALLGEFDAALEASRNGRELAEAMGDPQAQSAAAWATGIVQAARGEWVAGIDACRQSLALAPDALNAAIAAGWLGYAYLESGAPAEAIPQLEPSIVRLGHFHFPQLQGLFTAFLAEAHRLSGAAGRARELAQQSLDRCQVSRAPYGTASAERALGRLARDEGKLDEAEGRLGEALRIFVAIGARYDAARTHLDFATVAQRRGTAAGVGRHLAEAGRCFRDLGLPRHLEDVRRRAAEAGVPLET